MAQLSQPGTHTQEVAVRGVALGPVPGVILGRVPAGLFRRPRVAVAVRSPRGDEWTPLVASTHQVIMTWERWRAAQHDAVVQHTVPGRRLNRAAGGASPPVLRQATGGA
jgi:hypothetical protein